MVSSGNLGLPQWYIDQQEAMHRETGTTWLGPRDDAEPAGGRLEALEGENPLRAAITHCIRALAVSHDALIGDSTGECYACGSNWGEGEDRVHEDDCPAQEAERVLLLARAALEGGSTPDAPIGSVVCKADLPLGDDPDRCSAAMAKGRCEREAGHEGFHETRRGNYAWARTRAAREGGA